MPHDVLHRVSWSTDRRQDPEVLLGREWLVTNGLGGYASSSLSGACTRRYHGLLIAALPAPYGRTLMLNHISEEVRLPDGTVVRLGGEERHDGTLDYGAASLAEFRLETGLPVWRFQVGAWQLEKRVWLPYCQNTVLISYRMLAGEGGPVRLGVRPSVDFRPHEASVASASNGAYTVTARDERVEISRADTPPLRLEFHGARRALVLDGGAVRHVFYRVEESRGYDAVGTLWSPGYFRAHLEPGEQAHLLASTEDWDTIQATNSEESLQAELQRRRQLLDQASSAARARVGAELVLAADQFVVRPTTRVADAARARAAGDDVRTVIAGYHWFTDWGRDTMISLEGLTLTTGRHIEAGYIVRTFARYVRDGLIPNLFPEGEREGLYHTADATLWYFHAIDRYLHATGDHHTLELLLPTLESIAEHHLRGTRFGIHVDPRDGLLVQGEPGYQLTWMDAKVDDWVVTPRRGKAVEINALWHNALRLLESWCRQQGKGQAADELASHAERARESFNRRFWYEAGGYLYDVVDGEQGDDHSLRPNQVLAISLAHPVLHPSRWKAVLDKVADRLLTPVGLRSLAPGEPDYKSRYYGDLRSRDAAYHQGTVWAWLIGPYIDAWLKVHPGDHSTARQMLSGFDEQLGEACVGSISEIFDADAPYHLRGCVAQAWSVAEVLRCWALTEPERAPL